LVWFERVLAGTGAEMVNRGRGRVEAGLLAFWLGENERAAAYQREALEIGKQIDDPTIIRAGV